MDALVGVDAVTDGATYPIEAELSALMNEFAELEPNGAWTTDTTVRGLVPIEAETEPIAPLPPPAGEPSASSRAQVPDSGPLRPDAALQSAPFLATRVLHRVRSL